MSMSSTSFPSIVSPAGSGSYNLSNDIAQALYGTAGPATQQEQTAEYPFLQGATGGTDMAPYAKGGHVRRKPKQHVTVIIPIIQPHPLVGALTQALLMHHLAGQPGAMQRGMVAKAR